MGALGLSSSLLFLSSVAVLLSLSFVFVIVCVSLCFCLCVCACVSVVFVPMFLFGFVFVCAFAYVFVFVLLCVFVYVFMLLMLVFVFAFIICLCSYIGFRLPVCWQERMVMLKHSPTAILQGTALGVALLSAIRLYRQRQSGMSYWMFCLVTYLALPCLVL